MGSGAALRRIGAIINNNRVGFAGGAELSSWAFVSPCDLELCRRCNVGLTQQLRQVNNLDED